MLLECRPHLLKCDRFGLRQLLPERFLTHRGIIGRVAHLLVGLDDLRPGFLNIVCRFQHGLGGVPCLICEVFFRNGCAVDRPGQLVELFAESVRFFLTRGDLFARRVDLFLHLPRFFGCCALCVRKVRGRVIHADQFAVQVDHAVIVGIRRGFDLRLCRCQLLVRCRAAVQESVVFLLCRRERTKLCLLRSCDLKGVCVGIICRRQKLFAPMFCLDSSSLGFDDLVRDVFDDALKGLLFRDITQRFDIIPEFLFAHVQLAVCNMDIFGEAGIDIIELFDQGFHAPGLCSCLVGLLVQFEQFFAVLPSQSRGGLHISHALRRLAHGIIHSTGRTCECLPCVLGVRDSLYQAVVELAELRGRESEVIHESLDHQTERSSGSDSQTQTADHSAEHRRDCSELCHEVPDPGDHRPDRGHQFAAYHQHRTDSRCQHRKFDDIFFRAVIEVFEPRRGGLDDLADLLDRRSQSC